MYLFFETKDLGWQVKKYKSWPKGLVGNYKKFPEPVDQWVINLPLPTEGSKKCKYRHCHNPVDSHSSLLCKVNNKECLVCSVECFLKLTNGKYFCSCCQGYYGRCFRGPICHICYRKYKCQGFRCNQIGEFPIISSKGKIIYYCKTHYKNVKECVTCFDKYIDSPFGERCYSCGSDYIRKYGIDNSSFIPSTDIKHLGIYDKDLNEGTPKSWKEICEEINIKVPFKVVLTFKPRNKQYYYKYDLL